MSKDSDVEQLKPLIIDRLGATPDTWLGDGTIAYSLRTRPLWKYDATQMSSYPTGHGPIGSLCAIVLMLLDAVSRHSEPVDVCPLA